MVLVFMLFATFLLPCNGSRHIRDQGAAELQYIRGGNGASTHSSKPETYTKHDKMISAKQFVGGEAQNATPSEPRELLSSADSHTKERMMGHENKLSGAEAAVSRKSGSSVNEVIMTPPEMQEPENPRSSLITSSMSDRRKNTSRRMLVTKSSANSPPFVAEGTNLFTESPPFHGNVMDMDYSPAHKRPPIHN